VLYQLVTGQVPFGGDSALAIIAQHLQETPAAAHAVRRDVPPPLDAVILRALAKEPRDRYPSAAALAAAFAVAIVPAATPQAQPHTEPGSGPGDTHRATFPEGPRTDGVGVVREPAETLVPTPPPMPPSGIQPAAMGGEMGNMPNAPLGPQVTGPQGLPAQGDQRVNTPTPGYGQHTPDAATPPGGNIHATPPGGYAPSLPPGGYQPTTSPGGYPPPTPPGGYPPPTPPGGYPPPTPPGGYPQTTAPGGYEQQRTGPGYGPQGWPQQAPPPAFGQQTAPGGWPYGAYGPGGQPYGPGRPAGPAAPPRPARNNAWRIVAIVLAAVVVASLICCGGVWVLGSQATPSTRPSAAATPTATAPATPTAQVLYSDSLTGGASGWPTTANCFSQADGYHIVGAFTCWNNSVQVDDANISVQATQLKGATDAPFGIDFRGDTPFHNGYFFGVNANGKWQFAKYVNNSFSPISSDTTTAAQSGLNAVNTLGVQIHGGHFDFYVNGSKVGQADDSTYSSRQVALDGAANGTEVLYTNLTITATS
jgi:hypothetical protein